MAGKKKKKDVHPAVPVTAGEQLGQKDETPPEIRWRWRVTVGALLILSVLILFLSWIKLFDFLRLDRNLQDLLISYAGAGMSRDFDRQVALILVDKAAQSNPPFGSADPKHRAYHANLIRFLSKSGAKVIVFDVEFRTTSTDDPDLAQAIQEAERAGTKVVVGAFLEKDQYEPKIAAAIKQAIGDHWGIVDGAIPENKSPARYVRLAAPKNNQPPTLSAEQQVIPSLSLQAVRLLRYPEQPVTAWYDSLAGEVRLRDGSSGKLLTAIPVSNELGLLVVLPGKDDIPRESYQNILAHPDDFAGNYQDKVVLVGYQAGDELGVVDRFGSEFHATAVSTMLTGSYLRPVPILYHYLAIVLLVAIAAFLQIRFSNWMARTQTVSLPFLPSPINSVTIPTPLVLISLVYIVVVVLAFKVGHIVFDLSYHLAALILTYFLFVICRPLFTRQIKERKT